MSNSGTQVVEFDQVTDEELEQRLLTLSQEAADAAEAAFQALEALHLEVVYTDLKLVRGPGKNTHTGLVLHHSRRAYDNAQQAHKSAQENLDAMQKMIAERQADRKEAAQRARISAMFEQASRPAPIVELAFGLARRIKPGQVYEFQVHLSVPDDVEGWPYAEDEYVVGTSIETSDLFASWKPFPGHEEEVVIGPDNRKGFTRYLLTVGDDVDNLPRQGVVVVKVFRNGMFLHESRVDEFTLVLDEGND